MESFIDGYIKISGDNSEVNPEEEIVPVEEGSVEATPFVPDNAELFPVSPGPFSMSSSDSMFNDQVKKSIEEHLRESSSLLALKYEIDNNKILIQDLKSSVVSLKVSTSRIEKEIRDLSTTVEKYRNDKKQLDTSLIDLDFRFNELVTRQEETDTNNSITTNTDEVQINLQEIVDKIDGKIRQFDVKLGCIDKQNTSVKLLANDIQKNEEIMISIRGTLKKHQIGLNKLEALQNLIAFNQAKAKDKNGSPQVSNEYNNSLEKKVTEFISKIEINERSIASAWVGLIAALLLIPIAYFLGKFF